MRNEIARLKSHEWTELNLKHGTFYGSQSLFNHGIKFLIFDFHHPKSFYADQINFLGSYGSKKRIFHQ